MKKMITAEELIDGSAISQILQDMVDAIITALLAILSGIFEIFFIWLDEVLTAGILGDNPAIFIIGFAFFITAFIVWRGKK